MMTLNCRVTHSPVQFVRPILYLCAAGIILNTASATNGVGGVQHAPITALLPPPAPLRDGSSRPYALTSIASGSRSSPFDTTLFKYTGGTHIWPPGYFQGEEAGDAGSLVVRNGGMAGVGEGGGISGSTYGGGGGEEELKGERGPNVEEIGSPYASGGVEGFRHYGERGVAPFGNGEDFGFSRVGLPSRMGSRAEDWSTGPEGVRLLKALLRVFPLANDEEFMESREQAAQGGTSNANEQGLDSTEMNEDEQQPSRYPNNEESNQIQPKLQSSDYKSFQTAGSFQKAQLAEHNLEQMEPLKQLEEPSVKRGFYDTIAGVKNWFGNNNHLRHRPVVNRRAPESKHYSCIKNCIQGGKLHPIQCHTLC
ncbi:uncharacterized protein LOC108670362 [Hyalella azteca]|uniref:Uncharacterized protein LOC108670362 n=1 Tax=Hyalella azteca TaxID=294128 RepID=A0A8B7NJ16_HYAAZ|nr:uncharacterized protein LOC108670362 [Hyalella azteca]XP_047739778.1 uncharacterized protein LOC108670362 [Hyalella azteca]